jgi:hypothetical protein
MKYCPDIWQDLSRELAQVDARGNTIDLQARCKQQNDGIAFTLRVHEFSDMLRHLPEVVREQVASALFYGDLDLTAPQLKISILEDGPHSPTAAQQLAA